MDTTQTQTSELRLHFLDYWRIVKTRKAILFVVFLLVVLTTFTITCFQPKIYSAACRIKVEAERQVVEIFTPQGAPGYDPYFLQTQYEIIQSQKILYPVIERLNLQKQWAQRSGGGEIPSEVAFRRLKGHLAVRRFRDTSLIEIAVEDEDPYLAANIANTVAEVFERERLEVKRQQTMKGVDKLRDEIVQQQERVKQAQDKVEKLRHDLNVPIFSGMKLTETTVSQLENQLTAAKVEAVGRETRLSELQKLSPQQLRNVIGAVFTDASVQALVQNLTDTELRLEVLKEDFGPDHPNVKAAQASRDKLQEQLNARLEGIIRGFEVDYKMTKQRVDELQKQLDEAKSTSMVTESEAYRPFRNAQRETEMEEKLYEVLKTRFQQTSVEIDVPRSPVELLDRAEPVLFPVKPKMWLNMMLGSVVGLVLGIGLAFFIEFLDTSVKKMEDIEQFLGLPVLGVIARPCGLLIRDEASPSHVEAYRMLRTNIEFAIGDNPHKALAILSSGAGEGKSFTVANLAAIFAQHGTRVLVVDSDLRRPSVHKYLNVANEAGLADYLNGTEDINNVVRSTSDPNISIITAGGSAKQVLPMLTSQRMRRLIKEVSGRYDVVLYDTPPVLGVSDAAVVASEVGTAILVVQHRRFPRAMAQRARQVVENAGGKLLGVVVNNVDVGQDESYYYYHHYDEYLRQPARAANAPATATQSTAEQINLPEKY